MNSRREWHYVENLRAYMCFTFIIEDDVDDNNEYGNAIKLSRFAFVFVLSSLKVSNLPMSKKELKKELKKNCTEFAMLSISY